MEFVDTHCHIQSAGNSQGERTTGEIWAKYPDLTGKALVESAEQSGVTKLICVGCDLRDSQLAVSFAQQHETVWSSIGIHPHEAKLLANNDTAMTSFKTLVTEAKVVAVGECGLDYFYNHSPKADQIMVLRAQIELALANNLPLIFHVREAYDDFWPIFASYQGIRGVLHSFTDTTANMERAVENGLYLGVNGIATFAKQAEQVAMYQAIPLSNLLLETDAPFLTPTPYRGKVNEPKHIVTVAKFLSQLQSVTLTELATATTRNANTLFGLK
ncbi:MAG: TatD family hydrolase [Patescibacteria group bacterium]|nr:TatD family hydrolase [Patescibacteria group bacterium]